MTAEAITGRVTSGLGEGRHFTRLDWAVTQFVTRLGIDPYPGTLNLTVAAGPSRDAWHALRERPGVRIDPPDAAYCGARCYRVSLGGVAAAIVFPEVPGYPDDRIELIAAVSLRDTIGVADGDMLTVTPR